MIILHEGTPMFWDLDDVDPSSVACYDAADQQSRTYAELRADVGSMSAQLRRDTKLLVFLLCDISYRSLVAYLAALRAGHAVFLVDVRTPVELLRTLLGIYTPELFWSVQQQALDDPAYGAANAPDGWLQRGVPVDVPPINPDLGVLLSTSGTTGSPKLVRLTRANVQANAASIVEYLGIDRHAVPICNLPMSYSYGLSVVNSHLLAGGRLVMTNASMFLGAFWETFKAQQCTSFAGVPFTYQLLERIGFDKMDLPSLRTMTQAGGRLSVDRIRHFHDIAERKGVRFFVMYGQTEATARISYVPAARLGAKIGSIGIAIPAGTLEIEVNGRKTDLPKAEGEIVYSGPNVMLGYAESRACLSKGDEIGGVLHTGDIGYRDEEGFFFVTGRMKRFIKIYGLRVNLDEVERMLEPKLGVPVLCIGADDTLMVMIESKDETQAEDAREAVAKLYHLHRTVVAATAVPRLPYTSTGKKDYEAAKRQAGMA